MHKYWKQILLLSLPLLVAGVLFCLQDPIITRGLSWYLQKFSTKYLDGELHAENIYLKDGALILEEPRIAKSEFSHTTRVGARGEKMVLEYSIHPLELRLDIHVTVIHPTLFIDEESPSLEEFFERMMHHSNLARVNTSISLHKGEALLQGPEGPLRHVLFELDANSTSSGDYEGHLAINIDDKGHSRNAFNISVEKKDDNPLTAQCSFENMDCVALFRLGKFLWPSIDDWAIHQGTLDGSLSLILPYKETPYCEGEVLIRGLNVTNTQLRLSSEVEEARLLLQKNPGIASWSGMPSTVGLFELSKPTSVVFYRFGRPFWEMQDLKGHITLQPNEGADLSFAGRCMHRQRPFDISLEGEGRFAEEDQAFVDVALRLSSDEREDASIRFIAKQLRSMWDSAELTLRNFSQDEFILIQEPLARYFPDLGKIHVHSGSLDASVITYLKDYRVTDIKIDKIAARHLEFDIAPLDVAVSIGETSGELSVSCIPQDIFETLNADFKIRDGQLKVATQNDEFWRFQDINTHIGIRKGVFQRSILKGEFAGLWGSVEVDWNDPNQVMRLCFSGKAQCLKNLASDKIRKGIEKAFPDDHIAIKGTVSRNEDLLNVKGEISIAQDYSQQKMDKIAFGFDLEKSSDPFWDYWSGHPPASSYWENIGLEAMRTMIPELASPTMILQHDWCKRKSGIAGLVIRNGWFQGNNLALEKYISPYCFEGTTIALSGRGDFEGKYDHKTLAVRYNAYDVCLENQNFRLSTNSLSDNESDTVKPASHYFDLEKGTHFGFVPLRNASYYEKINGILFSNGFADVTLDPGKIYLHDVETFCNGMYLAGIINIDYTKFSEEILDIDIHSNALSGKLSQFRKLLPQLQDNPMLQTLSAEGKVSYRDDGASMNFHFEPDQCHFDSRIKGKVTDGSCVLATSDVDIDDLSLDFEYRHADEFFEITDVEGTVTMGKGFYKEEFLLACDHIRLNNITENDGEFDLWLGDKSRDLIRLVGKTRSIAGEPSMACFSLNKELTHFGHFHPNSFALTLKDWFEIEDFNLKFDFQLDRMVHDLGRFLSTGFLIAPETVKSIKDLKQAEGNFTADFFYDQQEAKFLFNVKGEQVTLGGKDFRYAANRREE